MNGLVLLFLYLNLASAAAYFFVAGEFRLRSLADRILTTFLLWITHHASIVLLLGVIFKSLNPTSLTVTNLIVLTALGIRMLWRSRFSSKNDLRPHRTFIVVRFSPLALVAVMCIAGEAAILAFKIYTFPPYVWDVLTYHLQPVVEWYQKGMIPSVIDTPVDRVNGYVLGLKLLHYWFVAFLGNQSLIELPQLLFGLMIPVAAYSLMRKLQVPRTQATMYAAVIYFIPSVLMESRTAQDHLSLTAASLIAVNFAVDVFYRKATRSQWPLTLAIAWVLNIKSSAPLFILAAALALLMTGAIPWRSIFKRRTAVNFALQLSVIAAISGYWYAKNYIMFGRYAGAIQHRMFDVHVDEPGSEAFYRVGLLLENIKAIPVRIWDVARYSADLRDISGFGMQFTAFGIVAILAMTLRYVTRSTTRRSPAAFILLCCGILQLFYFLLYFTPFNYRLFMFTPIAGIILWAYLSSRWRFPRLQTGVVYALALFIIVFNAASTHYVDFTTPERYKKILQLPEDQRTAPAFAELLDDSWEIIDQYLPANEPIGYFGGFDRATFPLYGFDMQRPTFFLGSRKDLFTVDRETKTITPNDQFFAFLKEKGIRFVQTGGHYQIVHPRCYQADNAFYIILDKEQPT